MLVLGYISFSLLRDHQFSWKGSTFTLSRFFYVIPTLLNVYAIFSVLYLNSFNIGFLNSDTLFQGSTALFPLVGFLLIIGANAFLVYLNIHKTTEIRLYKMATYLLAVIAIETCVSMYAFHIAGLEGLSWGLSILHLAFIGLSIRSYYTFRATKIQLRFSSSDLLLIIISIGTFAMVCVPFGLYNLYGDNSVVVGNTLSITNRESLQPYYTADAYYSPIMGFVSVFFASITGLNNLLLACNLPFLAAILLLPFVVYHFLKEFVTDDSRIAVLGAVIVCLMDGLALILLPAYSGNITRNVIDWTISPATSSLYASNICHLWLAPFKTFAAASAIAACTILHKNQTINYVLGGALFFLSFMNPRYSILTIILLVFLFGIKRINIKGIGIFLLSLICFGGFTLPVHFYKQIIAFFKAINTQGLISESLLFQLNETASVLIQNNFLLITFSVIISLIGIILLTRFHLSKKTGETIFTSYFSQKNFPMITLGIGKKKNILISSITPLLIGILLTILIYIIINAYSPNTLLLLKNNSFFTAFNSTILRYHILLAFFAVGLISLRFPRRIAFTIIAIILLFYFGGIFTKSITLLPLVFTILAIPLISSCIKHKRKIITFSLLIFVFSGIFSSTFYSATVSTQTEIAYDDLPHLLEILMEKGEVGSLAYSPSYYTYFVNRIVKQTHMSLSSDPDYPLYIIDTNYMNNTLLETLLNDANFTQLYYGNRFVLLEKN